MINNMMEKYEFSRICKDFCAHPASVDGLSGVVESYPYFQLAHLMACYGRHDAAADTALAFRTEDRAFLYRFLSGEFRLAEEESSALSAATANIPKEIHSQDGRSALQVLDDMLEKFKTNPPKISELPTDFPEEELYEDLGKSSNMERMNFVSETLAKLYVEQKEYDRAVKVYKVLIEKHPENSDAYSAAIESVKKLKNA